MSTGEYERNGPEGRNRTVDRFLLDLDDNRMTLLDLRGYTEDLLLNSDLGVSQQEADMLVNEAFRDIDIETISPDELKNRMMLVPFEVLSPLVDSQLPVTEAVLWYKTAIGRIHAMTEKKHDGTCLTFNHGESCERSRWCPKIQVAKHLELMTMYGYDEVYEEIRGPLYDNYELGVAKERLAIQYGYRTSTDAEKLIAEYHTRQQAYISKIGRRAITPLTARYPSEPLEPENS